MSYPQQPAPPAPMAPAPAVAQPPQAPAQQAPAPQQGQVQQNFQNVQDQGGQSATDAAINDPAAWQVAAESDARYEIVQRPMNGEVG